jgi:hypothetical protein
MQTQIYQRKTNRELWVKKQVSKYLADHTFVHEDLMSNRSGQYNLPAVPESANTIVIADWQKVVIFPKVLLTLQTTQTTKSGCTRFNRQDLQSFPGVTVIDRWF